MFPQHCKQTLLSRLGDYLMLPVMYLLQFPSLEIPQRTHFWNNTKYATINHRLFDESLLIVTKGNTDAVERWWGMLPIFHMPLIGGWRDYVVLEPVVRQDQWFVGWIPRDVIGISQIPLQGAVRVLIGSGNTFFFGINEHGDQIELRQVGEGRVGLKTEFSSLPLL
jgi:hypothetical protein